MVAKPGRREIAAARECVGPSRSWVVVQIVHICRVGLIAAVVRDRLQTSRSGADEDLKK
jgi:hypothetical protein